MAAITAELALGISKFQSSLRQAQSSMRGFQSGAASGSSGSSALLSGAAKAAKGVALAGAAAAAAAVGVGTALAAGVKNALDLGGKFSDLASQIGSTAGQAMVLASAFEANGMGAEEMVSSINRMQRSLNAAMSAGGKDAFSSLGLDPAELFSADPSAAFQQVAEALGGIENPTERAARAMEIFGRSGARLQTLFADPEAMRNAATQVGGMAGLLDANAAKFDQVSDVLGGLGKKVQGFFVGVGAEIVDQLLPLAEWINGLDFSGIGQKVGEGLARAAAIARALFEELGPAGLGKLVLDSLVLSMKEAVNALYRGMVAVLAAVGQMFIENVRNTITLFSILATADFWKGMGNALAGAAKVFGAILLDLVAKAVEELKRIPGARKLLGDADTALRGTAQGLRESAAGNLARGGDQLAPAFETASRRIGETLTNIGDAFTDAYAGTRGLLDTSGEQAAIGDAAERVRRRLAANEEARKNEPNEAPGTGTGAAAPTAAVGSARLAPGSFASAINLVMGRSANELILDETKKQTETQRQMADELKEINEKLTPPTGNATPAAPVPVDTTARFG